MSVTSCGCFFNYTENFNLLFLDVIYHTMGVLFKKSLPPYVLKSLLISSSSRFNASVLKPRLLILFYCIFSLVEKQGLGSNVSWVYTVVLISFVNVSVFPSANITHFPLKGQMNGCDESCFCLLFFVSLIHVSVFVASTMPFLSL